MGHGEDPSQRKSTQCASDRDTREGEDVFRVFVCVNRKCRFITRPVICPGKQQRL